MTIIEKHESILAENQVLQHAVRFCQPVVPFAVMTNTQETNPKIPKYLYLVGKGSAEAEGLTMIDTRVENVDLVTFVAEGQCKTPVSGSDPAVEIGSRDLSGDEADSFC